MLFNFTQVYFTIRKVDKVTINSSVLFIMCHSPKIHQKKNILDDLIVQQIIKLHNSSQRQRLS